MGPWFHQSQQNLCDEFGPSISPTKLPNKLLYFPLFFPAQSLSRFGSVVYFPSLSWILIGFLFPYIFLFSLLSRLQSESFSKLNSTRVPFRSQVNTFFLSFFLSLSLSWVFHNKGQEKLRTHPSQEHIRLGSKIFTFIFHVWLCSQLFILTQSLIFVWKQWVRCCPLRPILLSIPTLSHSHCHSHHCSLFYLPLFHPPPPSIFLANLFRCTIG